MKPFHNSTIAVFLVTLLLLLRLPCHLTLEVRQVPHRELPAREDLLHRSSSNRESHNFVTLVSEPALRGHVKTESGQRAERRPQEEHSLLAHSMQESSNGTSLQDSKRAFMLTTEMTTATPMRRTTTTANLQVRRGTTTATPASVSLQRAPPGHLWVIRESSGKHSSPTLSEYRPLPEDVYVEQPGNPWKLVKSSSTGANAVIELMSVDRWSHAVAERKENDRLNFRGPTHRSGTPVSFWRRLAEPFLTIGAAISTMGLVTAQAWGFTFMLGLVLVLLLIDKGCQCCGRDTDGDCSRMSEGHTCSFHSPVTRQLTSWEVIPGVEYTRGYPSEFHLG